jgi:hypothetical protein
MACLNPGRYPLDMVRGRLTIQAGKGDHYSGIMHATRSIIRDVRPLPFAPDVLQPLQPVFQCHVGDCKDEMLPTMHVAHSGCIGPLPLVPMLESLD